MPTSRTMSSIGDNTKASKHSSKGMAPSKDETVEKETIMHGVNTIPVRKSARIMNQVNPLKKKKEVIRLFSLIDERI